MFTFYAYVFFPSVIAEFYFPDIFLGITGLGMSYLHSPWSQVWGWDRLLILPRLDSSNSTFASPLFSVFGSRTSSNLLYNLVCIWNFLEWNFFNSDDSILNKANNNIIYFYTHYGLLNTFTCIIHSFKFILDIFLRLHYLIITLSFRAISNSENRILLSWIVGSKLQVYDSVFSPQ